MPSAEWWWGRQPTLDVAAKLEEGRGLWASGALSVRWDWVLTEGSLLSAPTQSSL